MDSASFRFLAFGLAVALISNLSRSRVWRSAVLLLASIVFLGLLSHNPILFLPLFGFLLLGYVGMVLLERGQSESSVWGILAVLLVYIWLKKYTFLPEGIFLRSPYFTLGLSYIFFRVLHLLIEAGDRREKWHISPWAYLLYTLNFTTLVCGPIQRYDEFARDQFATQPIVLGGRTIGLQLERIVYGFFKVNVLAMLLHAFEEDALGQMSQPLPVGLKIYAAFRLAILYPLFLYCNFSGYIDIVIALARLMRVRLPENFDRPFSSSSFIEFWNRWHITLSAWFKAYVYNPTLVALMRRVPSTTAQPFLGILCFFITFFLVGVWHGRTSEFLFYGLLLGGGMAVNKLWQVTLTHSMGRKRYSSISKHPLYVSLARGLTFSWFSLSLFWFWADWHEIRVIFFSIGLLSWGGTWLAIWAIASVLLTVWEWLRAALFSIRTREGPVLTSRYARVVYASALGLAAFVITILLSQPAPAIVYKAF